MQLYLLSPDAIPHSPYQTQDCENAYRKSTQNSFQPGLEGTTNFNSKKHPLEHLYRNFQCYLQNEVTARGNDEFNILKNIN